MKKPLSSEYQTIQHNIVQSFTIENIPEAVMAVDIDSHIVVWNKAAEALYGYTSEEIIGKNAWGLLKTRPLNATIKDYKKHIKTQGVWDGELIQYTKSGKKLFILSSVSNVKKGRKVIGRIGFNRDISYQKQVEYNLRFLSGAAKALSSSLDYQTTLNKVAQLAVPRIADWCSIELFDEHNILQQVAVAHRDPARVKWAKELRKKDSGAQDSNSVIMRVISTGISEFYPYISEEAIIQSAQNAEHLALLKKLDLTSVITVPITSSETNRAIGAISFISAESHRQYTQIDLETAEKLAARASLAIENAKLYQSASREIAERKQVEARLREMENRKDNFISMASHELKTPITSLKIYTDLLEKQLRKDNLIQHDKTLSVMKNQMNKLTLLITDLLNLSKIQAGKLEYRMDVFNLYDLIQEVIEQLQPTTTHKIQSKLEHSLFLFGDRERLGQVLINLITNAIKYSPHSEKVVIQASVKNKEILVSVRDFGIGIDKEHQKKIFERFYQVSNEDKTYPGLGMGLFISHEIISRHGGKIWVSKARGKGSIFSFSISKHADK